MKNGIVLFLAAIATAFGSAIAPQPAECEATLNILTTHTVLKSIAEEIGGKHVAVSCLATGREDPHAIQAKPSYMAAARKADLFMKIGMELEIGYEELVIDGSRNYKIRMGQPGHLDTSLNALRLEVPTTRVDRSMGDVHPQGNPHYWMDPYNARIMARSIANRLASLDAENAADYEGNYLEFKQRIDTAMFGEKLVKELGGDRLWALEISNRLESHLKDKQSEDLIDGWYEKSRKLRGMKIITYHRSWVYFAKRIGLDIIAELEPKPGIPPGPGHLRHVIAIAEIQQAKAILMEPFYNRKAADFVALKTGAKVVEATNAVAGQSGVHDYFSLIDNVMQKLSAAVSDT